MEIYKTATAVIGAAWGDEGKGLITDALSDEATVVIRYNSGAQAGHTVQMEDGRRHVFHHFGSGSFRGAKTYLSQFFICNPMAFTTEKRVLREKMGGAPSVYVNPQCLVTTPWDMMINQVVEESRGSSRHGSCGMGFNETIQRSKIEQFSITIEDIALLPSATLSRRLQKIRTEYVPRRLMDLGVNPSQEWMRRLNGDGIVSLFLDACAEFLGAASMAHSANDMAFAKCDRIVFEGAQGLLLDAERGAFPYVTNSRTGLTNILPLAQEIGIKELKVIHASRAYATRHGAGPFPRERAGLRYEDKTNVPNEWQGTLRFGDLDIDLLADSISQDYADQSFEGIEIKRCLAITCLDQVGAAIDFWNHGDRQEASSSDFLRILQERIFLDQIITSHGPTKNSVSF